MASWPDAQAAERHFSRRWLRCRLLSGPRPLPQSPGSSPGRGSRASPVGAALAATGRCGPRASIKAAIASKLAPTRPRPGRRVESALRGRGLDRDMAAAFRWLRCRLLSGSRPLPQSPGSSPGRGSRASPVGAALAATGRASIPAAIASKLAPIEPRLNPADRPRPCRRQRASGIRSFRNRWVTALRHCGRRTPSRGRCRSACAR